MADNRDRSMVGAPAAPRLPVALSNKIASNQMESQTRQSRDVSKDSRLPAEASLIRVKAPKRRATPQSLFVASNKRMKMTPPQSLFVTSNKRMKMTPPQSLFVTSNKKMKMTPPQLPLNETKSKPTNVDVDLKLIKNKENSKGNENPSVAKIGIERIPLSQQGQGPAPKTSSGSVPYIEIATKDSMEIAAKGMLSASGHDQYYLAQFNKFYEDYRACNLETANRLLELENSNIEKHYENESLERRLKVMTQKNVTLEDKLSQQEALNAAVHQKYIDALKRRIDVEKSCQNQIQETKSLFNQQKAKLDENNSEIGQLKAELHNMQETNRGMANVLSDIQEKLKEAKKTGAELVKQNNKQAAELEKQKIKMQDAAADRDELKRQVSQLKSELKQKALEANELSQLQINYEQLQVLYDEVANQLEVSRNEKETLQDSVAQLEAFRSSLIEVNEEYYNESVDQKETIFSLESTVKQQSRDLEELAKSHEELRAANHQQLSLHREEVKKVEAEAKSLLELFKNYKAEMKVQAELWQTEKASFVAELDELKKSNSSLKDDIKQKENDKKKLAEEEEITTNNLKSTISGLQDDLKQKDIKLIGLEHEKDGIIMQLKDKINTICSTIKQPIIASSLPKSLESKKSSYRLPRKVQEVKSTGSVAKTPKKSPSKRGRDDKLSIVDISSDFESEDEMPVKVLFAKRQNLAVVKPQEDLFDSLRNGTI